MLKSKPVFIILILIIFGTINFQGANQTLSADTQKDNTEVSFFYQQDFESFSAGDEPTDWIDTNPNNSMVINSSLFNVAALNNNQVLGTNSIGSNIHSHYAGNIGSNYVYSGRMQITDVGSGIGVTFFSDYNQSDNYYRLRRYGNSGSFHLSSHGTGITGGVTNSGVVPVNDTWYRFKIEVEDSGLQTNIRAKVWADGATEPIEWQIDAYDSSASRLTAGAIGVWSYSSGSKYWDDLLVEPITPPEPHTLMLTNNGNGNISANPDLIEYENGVSVQLTAVPDANWTFFEWNGDINGNDNPATIVMNGNKSVTAVFIEDLPQTITTNVVGSGTITINPDQATYSIGDVITITAVPDANWYFGSWSGDHSGTTNPATIVIDNSKTITATFTQEPPGFINEDFNSYSIGTDPANWQDTSANSSMTEDNTLFAIGDVNGELAFGTSSMLSNIHSHHQGTGSSNYNNYVYSGRMLMTNTSSGIGVTFLSDYNQTDNYYRLRRFGNNGSFHISPHGTSITGGVTNSGVVPETDTWYRFKIEVEDTGSQTNIRANVWNEGNSEPTEWQIDAYDSSASRLSAGTIGLWGYNSGSKYWDDLLVESITPPGPHTLTLTNSGSGSTTALPNAPDYLHGTSVELTAVADAGWQFNNWSGDLSGNSNPATIVMNANKNITAVFVEDVPQTLTTTVAGNGTIIADPDQATYNLGDTVTVTAVPDAGWIFSAWSGDLSGSNNPANIVMDGDKTVTATFTEDLPQTVTTTVIGNGTVTIEPDQTTYSIGDVITVTAVPDAAWYFDSWSGDLVGNTNPTTLAIDSSKVITVTFTQEPPGLVDEDFNSYSIGTDPANWQDTTANNSMAEDNSLFAIDDVNGELAFGTTSALGNIHSHYQGTGSSSLSNYVYSGRMLMTSANSGLGVTFLSDYNQTDKYYRLRRYGNGGSFRLNPHGTNITGGVTDSGVAPVINTWYRFKIEVEDVGSQTNIRVNIWADGTAEPAGWQIDAYDSSASRLSTGTIGLWGYSSGSKYWDDLAVVYLSAGPFTLTVNNSGNGNITANPDQEGYSRDDVVTMTANPDTGWQFAGWDGDLSGNTNPTTITMSSDKTVTALFTPISSYTITTNVTGNGSIVLNPDQANYSENTPVTVTAVPATGWLFTGWTGDLAGTTNPSTLTVNGNKNITANFVEDLPLALTVNSVGNGTTVTTPSKESYSYNEAVTISAEPDSGWHLGGWQSYPSIVSGWWDAQWSYRLPITVNGSGFTRTDAPADVDLSFTDAWASIGVSGELDLNSLRVIEVDSNNNIIDTAVPFQFDPAAGFDANTNAAGTLIILLSGNTGPSTNRIYHVYYDVTGKSFTPAVISPRVSLTDNVTDEGLAAYRIDNDATTYYYDKIGGGFSSIIDANGNDWINYNATFGAGGTFRGIPNLVYPEGYMHPGNGGVTSTIVHEGPLKTSISSTSNDNNWETLWEIYPDFAQLTVLRTNRNYWFLYEGTPGGLLDVGSDIVVRADGTQTLASESWTGDLAGEEWVYFGDPAVGRSLYVANHQQDTAVDSYYAMSGMMTVFGFGRQGLSSNAFMNIVPANFTIGLVDDTTYGTVASEIQAAYEPFAITLGNATTQEGSGSANGTTLAFGITANQVVTATFTELNSPTLTVTIGGNGSVTIEPDLSQYAYGQTVTVTAVPDSGWRFLDWTGDQTNTINPLAFEVTENTTLTANFAEDVPLTLAVNTTGNGSIQLTPDQPTYSYGQVVTATAVADIDWYFDSWSGDVISNNNPITFMMDANKVISANFVNNLPESPIINIWHGDQHRYGHIGLPQIWYNILGNVSDPDGIDTFIYTLNGSSPVSLSIGSDNKRLAEPGDFNVDLHYQDLQVGDNLVIITAIDNLGNQAVKTVNVNYENRNTWPSPYMADWSTAATIEDVAQVVDGEWEIQANGVRILDPDYDRLIAIGDVSWTDYEVAVPITINEVDFAEAGAYDPGLGLLMRWDGHTDTPVCCRQPKSGWEPLGAIGWWVWRSSTEAELKFYASGSGPSFLPELDTTYMFKMRVESTPGQGGLYKIKVWEQGEPEPETWNLSLQKGASDIPNGSVVLISHFVDATFGNVTITPLSTNTITLDATTIGNGSILVNPDKVEYSYGETVSLTATPDTGWTFSGWHGDLTGYDNPAIINMTGSKQVSATFVSETTPPTISNIVTTPYTNSAVVTWNTDTPASSIVAYGETDGYELGSINDNTQRTSHTITLTDLVSNTTYHYQITSIDGNNNAANSNDVTFTTTDDSSPSDIVSDDFNVCAINNGIWSFIDPVGDSTMMVNGTQAILTVPAGVAHDVWGGSNNAPRLMQTANDTDFEIEVKYESIVSESYEMQGVIIEQDANNYLRFDFYGNNGQVKIFAARIVNGAATAITNMSIPVSAQPMFMRIERIGNSWMQAYSTDGITWTSSANFTHDLSVSQVGIFAGNAGANPPAHTAVVDYFFNTTLPIVPEDSNNTNGNLTMNIVGNGSVSQIPNQAQFSCGEAVELTAIADSGWVFDSWSGDHNGSDNPAILLMDSDKVVTATFVTEGTDTMLPVIFNINATSSTEFATITWQTDELASSEVAYGETNGYELGNISDAMLKSSHAITLTGLISNTTYHYQITSADASNNAASTDDATFATTNSSNPGDIVSDDFNVCAINNGLWSFVDPVGDSSATINGTQLLLSVPPGVKHEPLWSNTAARLMQPVNNEDFEVEVKFEAAVSDQYEMQGSIIEQDADDYLRFDFYGNNGNSYIFAARVVNGSFMSISNVLLGQIDDPMYMRIERMGNNWTQSYSLDGTAWIESASFLHDLTMNQIGVFAGNAGVTPPAHTAVIDYFFNTATPILPEDNNSPTCN